MRTSVLCRFVFFLALSVALSACGGGGMDPVRPGREPTPDPLPPVGQVQTLTAVGLPNLDGSVV